MESSAPLIILCPPRSCSSVICAMLGRHPETYGFPELNLFLTSTLGELLELQVRHQKYAGLPEAGYTAGLMRTIMNVEYSNETADSFEHTQQWLQKRSHWLTLDVFNYLLKRIYPRIGIDKSPRTAMSRRSMNQALSYYPAARFLHLTRHPVTTVISMCEGHQRLSAAVGSSAVDNAELAPYYLNMWYLSHEMILAFTRLMPSFQMLRMRAEDLLSSPDDTLAKVANWLNLSNSNDAIASMKHPERSPYAKRSLLPIAGENDPEFLENPCFRPVQIPEKFIFPAEYYLDEKISTAHRNLATHLGYELTEVIQNNTLQR